MKLAVSNSAAVLDTWAMVAFLRGESSAPTVRQAIEAGAAASWINLGEVQYIESRRVGFDTAELAVESMAVAVAADEPTRHTIRAAARIKADGGISFADAFAIELAERLQVPLLTGDPEIIGLSRPTLQVRDIRT